MTLPIYSSSPLSKERQWNIGNYLFLLFFFEHANKKKIKINISSSIKQRLFILFCTQSILYTW